MGHSKMLAHLESESCATTCVQLDKLAAKHILSDHYVRPGFKAYLRTGARRKFQSKPIFNRSTKSFGCNKCDRTFPTDEIMAAHIASNTHHPLAFRCPGCQAQMATLSALLAHVEAKTCSEGISYGTGSIGELLRYLWQSVGC